MKVISLLLVILPSIATAQLRELLVSEMQKQGANVVQANVEFTDNAIVFVYSMLDNLTFRSSMAAINKSTYNRSSNRYELLVNPVKQIIFAGATGFVEIPIGTINPKAKDVLYFKIEEKLEEQLGKASVA